MKILYVADNRNRSNYGCRATSTALSQIISINNNITGRVTGRYTHNDNGNLFYISCLPKGIYKKLGKVKHWDEIKIGTHLFFNMIKPHGRVHFSRFDFMSMDLDKSIDNLLKCIPANPALSEFDLRNYDFDAMVVNGEGSFIFSTPPWRESMVITMLMHWAQKMGKKVYFLNAMLSDSPVSAHNEKTLEVVYDVFKKCEVIQVREQQSLDYAHKYMPELNPVMKPDALFSWYTLVNDSHRIENGKYYMDQRLESDAGYYEFDFTKPYICISGSSVAGSYSDKQPIINRFVNLTNKVKSEFPAHKIFIVETCEGDEFLLEVAKLCAVPVVGMNTPLIAAAKILANASAYITGRYHPSIMASLGGTPCIYFGSNSHKTYSIQELLEYEDVHEFNFLFDNNEMDEMVMRTKGYIEQGITIRKKIQSRAAELSKEALEISDLIV